MNQKTASERCGFILTTQEYRSDVAIPIILLAIYVSVDPYNEALSLKLVWGSTLPPFNPPYYYFHRKHKIGAEEEGDNRET